MIAAGMMIVPMAICLTIKILAVIREVMKRADTTTNLSEIAILNTTTSAVNWNKICYSFPGYLVIYSETRSVNNYTLFYHNVVLLNLINR
jgi:hypothetical protein